MFPLHNEVLTSEEASLVTLESIGNLSFGTLVIISETQQC